MLSIRQKEELSCLGQYDEPPVWSQVAAKTLPTLRYRGLRNDGNDCYLNASLQMLLTVPPFAPSLVGKASLVGELGDLAKSIVALSQDLKVHTTQGFTQAAESTTVKNALGPFDEMFHTNKQQDAHECVTAILDGLKETKEEEDEVFGFKVNISQKCKSCPHAQ
jgi:ubiquitin C-terminal hydrolase